MYTFYYLFRAHRLIVASGSRYMLEVFMKYSVEDLPRVRVPYPFNQKNELHSDDQVSRILKYLYANQNINVIRDEINDENFYSLYAQAHSLSCERLLDDLRELAVTSLLNDKTAMKLYLDAIEHQDKKILKACTLVIIERFEEICAQEANTEHLLELDIKNLLSILKSDKLNLVNEVTLVELVKAYTELRDKIPKKLPQSAEERAGPELWALLTEDEKKNRTAIFKEEEEKLQSGKQQLQLKTKIKQQISF